jgi:hypothetical protein
MVLASLDRLHVVDARQLRVPFAGGVGGAHERRAQQRRAGLGHGLTFAVALAKLRDLFSGVSP